MSNREIYRIALYKKLCAQFGKEIANKHMKRYDDSKKYSFTIKKD